MKLKYTIWVDEVGDDGLTRGATLCSGRTQDIQEAEGLLRRLTEIAKEVSAARGDISVLKEQNKDIDFYG